MWQLSLRSFTSDILPYCITGGVPTKPIKFKWTIDQILEHESILYPEEERFSKEELEKYLPKQRGNNDKSPCSSHLS